MSLIAMCCHDTVENKRSQLTRQTLRSLKRTVDFSRHRLIVIDNASCENTKSVIDTFKYQMPFDVITFQENVGTAIGINAAWKLRKEGENLCKIDNDVSIKTNGWADLLEDAISRMPDKIGICCAKRKDLLERPDVEGWAKSELLMLPQMPGERNLVIEIVGHAMGTLQMYNHKLIDKIGGLVAPGLYGFDDSAAAIRCQVAGFISCFLHGIEIDHMDVPGEDGGYTKWKQDYSGEKMEIYNYWKEQYLNGTKNIYHPL